MTQAGAVIVVVAWEKHQHYRDRDPPWIKLYRDLLSAESWVLGTDESRLVQVASMLLAARYRNATPLNFSLFKKVAGLDLSRQSFDKAIKHLAETGFLEIQGDTVPCKQDASGALAKCSSEAEGETEGEKSRAEHIRNARRRASTRRCPDDWQPTAEQSETIRTECPDINLLSETRKFRDHEFARPRSDWAATWRNWMREAQSRSTRARTPRKTRYEEMMDAAQKARPAAQDDPVFKFLTGGGA